MCRPSLVYGIISHSDFTLGRKPVKIPVLSSDTAHNKLNSIGAALFDQHGDAPITAGASTEVGASFFIPTLVPALTPTGDGRKFMKSAFDTRQLPLPLAWQFKSSAGHDQSVLVGRIDEVEVTEDGIHNVRGVFDTGPYGREAERLVRGGFLTGVSADIVDFEGTEVLEDEGVTTVVPKKGKISNRKINIESGKLAGATLVNIPAFQWSKIYLEEDFNPMINESNYELLDGEYSSDDQENAIVASAYPAEPPRSWFSAPNTSTPEPLEITEEGQVFGYLALWESTHIGMAGQKVHPPRSATKYKYFRTGKVRCNDGSEVHTGSITLVGGHAPLNFSAAQAAKHYDDTNSAVVDVCVGEDQFGIWVAGAVRPDVSPSQIRSMRGSGISGDWRPIHGKLELVRACFVNTPGFMTTRAMVAGGQIQALVAAGTSTLEEMRTESALSAHLEEVTSRLEDRLFILENKDRIDEAINKLSVLSAKGPVEDITDKVLEESEEDIPDDDLEKKIAELAKKFNG